MEKELIEMSDEAYLYVEHYKNDEKPMVIFIPGYCCTTTSFHKNAKVLAKDYDVVVYDPRGQGCSSKGLFGHTVSRNALDLKEIIEHYHRDDVSVVAWSMAGQFIMDYVRQFGTKNLASIILADCPLHALGDEEWNTHKSAHMDFGHYLNGLCTSYNQWEKYCEDFAIKIWSGIDDTRIDEATKEFVKTPPWIAFAIYSDMIYRNGFPYLAKAEVPMLFTGADSKVTKNGISLANKWYPESRPKEYLSKVCTFDRGGHVFFDVEADKFNRELLDFLLQVYHE